MSAFPPKADILSVETNPTLLLSHSREFVQLGEIRLPEPQWHRQVLKNRLGTRVAPFLASDSPRKSSYL